MLQMTRQTKVYFCNYFYFIINQSTQLKLSARYNVMNSIEIGLLNM